MAFVVHPFGDDWEKQYAIYQGMTRQLPATVTLNQDEEWNRTLFPQEKANKLFEIFEAMRPCIQKCMLQRYANAREMAMNYCALYDQCHAIIWKNMKNKFSGYPPSVFSAAVHTYVMHQGYYIDPKWRVICAVFEYTSMEISALIKERDTTASSETEHQKAAKAAAVIHHWLWPAWGHGTGGFPHDMIRETHERVNETHEKVHSSHEKLEEVLERLNQIENAMKKRRDGEY